MTEDGIVVMEFLVTFLTSLLKRHKTSIAGDTYNKQVIAFRKFQWGIKGGDIVGIHHQLSQ